MPPATRVYVLMLMAVTVIDVTVGQIIGSEEAFALDWGRTFKVRYFPAGRQTGSQGVHPVSRGQINRFFCNPIASKGGFWKRIKRYKFNQSQNLALSLRLLACIESFFDYTRLFKHHPRLGFSCRPSNLLTSSCSCSRMVMYLEQ